MENTGNVNVMESQQMFCTASVSYSDLLGELQRRYRMNQVQGETSYFESLVFDLHMAQKSLQRAMYAQQVNAVRMSGHTCPKKTSIATAALQVRLDYPER